MSEASRISKSDSDSVFAENVFRLFLESSNSKSGDSEIFSYLLDYLSNFEDDEENNNTLGENSSQSKSKNAENPQMGILFEDFSSYELDDFLYFYLEDNFENYSDLQKKSKNLFKRFLKFAVEKKLLTSEAKDEWEEILSS